MIVALPGLFYSRFCAHKTEVVEMDKIEKFKFDSDRWVGCIKMRQNDAIFFNIDKKFTFCIFWYFFFFIFLGVWDSVEIIISRHWLKYWFVKTECLNVFIFHFSKHFHA